MAGIRLSPTVRSQEDGEGPMTSSEYDISIQPGHIARHTPRNAGAQGREAAVVDIAQDLLLPLPVPTGSRTHGQGKCNPYGKQRPKAKRKIGWITKMIRVVFGAISAFCKCLIKAVFKFM